MAGHPQALTVAGRITSYNVCYTKLLRSFICQNEEHQALLLRPENSARVEALARAYFGPDVGLTFSCAQRAPELSRRELRDEIKGNPVVKKMIDEFGAVIVNFDPIN